MLKSIPEEEFFLAMKVKNGPTLCDISSKEVTM